LTDWGNGGYIGVQTKDNYLLSGGIRGAYRMDYVLIITIHADPAMAPGYEEWGGTHTYMKELLDGFGVEKIPCLLVTRKCMPFPDIEQYNEYCKIIRLHNGDAEPIEKSLLQNYHEYNIAQIQSIIDKHGKPIIIHSVYWNSGRLAMELGEKNNVPFVHSVISNARGRIHRGAIEPIPKRAEYEQQIYEQAKWILCVSEDERQDILHFYNIAPDKVCIAGQHIHETFCLPAHDVNGFPRLSININTERSEKIAQKYNAAYAIETDDQYWNHKVFTYMGRISFHKGIDQIIKAWHRLYKHYGKACPPLWMAGGSVSEIHHVRNAIKNDIPEIDMLEENRLLVWWGYLDTVGLSTILLKTLVMITHSLYEPGGRVIVEAMSEGVPVIATPNGFAKDYIVNWRNGFLVDYGDNTELYSRLVHFLRQPFLSDALGQNARQDARKIIKKWNFFENHLMAYGMKVTEIPFAMCESPDYDYFKVRKINLFPYHNFPLSETYIREFVIRLTSESILECIPETNVPSTSDIFRVKTTSYRIIVKCVFTRLRIGPIFNPFDIGCYVKKATKSFRVELNAYQRSASNIMFGYDDLHYLFAFKELESIENSNLILLKECIDYIIHKTDTTTETEKELFLKIIHKDPYTHENITAMYHQLEQELSDYDFEQSGRFSEVISWASAPFILDYNQDNFPDAVLHELRTICNYFYQYVCHDTEKTLRSINEDIQFKHFLRNNGCLELIDLEKTTIGCVEMELAGLLYSYWYTIDNDITLTTLLDYVPESLNRRKIVSSMAYICFYDIQVFTVMQRTVPDSALAWLRVLYQTAQQ
jgi:glycosyltransferase involved in cell wall biosynthesis